MHDREVVEETHRGVFPEVRVASLDGHVALTIGPQVLVAKPDGVADFMENTRQIDTVRRGEPKVCLPIGLGTPGTAGWRIGLSSYLHKL